MHCLILDCQHDSANVGFSSAPVDCNQFGDENPDTGENSLQGDGGK